MGGRQSARRPPRPPPPPAPLLPRPFPVERGLPLAPFSPSLHTHSGWARSASKPGAPSDRGLSPALLSPPAAGTRTGRAGGRRAWKRPAQRGLRGGTGEPEPAGAFSFIFLRYNRRRAKRTSKSSSGGFLRTNVRAHAYPGGEGDELSAPQFPHVGGGLNWVTRKSQGSVNTDLSPETKRSL